MPTYINNVARFLSEMTPNYMEFLATEMEIIQEELKRKIEEERRTAPKMKMSNRIKEGKKPEHQPSKKRDPPPL